MKAGRVTPIFFAIVSVGIMAISGISQETPPTQDEQARIWKARLKEYPPWKISRELDFLFSFPDEELASGDIYLWQAHNIDCDADGNIYVTDQKQRCLFKFDGRGRFLLKKGREGQGPGDFLNPYSLDVSGKTVYVADTIKRDIQVFDQKLDLVRSFKTLRSYTNIAVGADGRIFATPFRMSADMPLVDVLDERGVLQYSFGQPMAGNAKQWTVPNFVHLDIDGRGQVLLAYWHLATVCRYSAKGELLAVHQLDHKGMKEAEEFNRDRMDVPDNRVFRVAIYGLRAKEDGFFVLHNYPITEVLELDADGKAVNGFWVARSHDYSALDFVVREAAEPGGREILLMQGGGGNRVDVFRPKKKRP